MKGKSGHIIAINDIKYQMEEQEIESWRKLIRVITHEIMNSITPITTLTLAIKKKFTLKDRPKAVHELNPDDVTEALKSADIIEERSEGLIHFIEKYKTLTKLPPLNLVTIDLPRMFERMQYLFAEHLQQQDIRLEIDTTGLNEIPADRKMMDQVFIPFFTTRENGSGIGLSLCRQIIRLHKGEITIKSSAGSGTNVYLKFYNSQ
jgi:nitrogen fixation/metabolism regulation signal transduction histidine kinase